jgi:hypothetical protein
MTGRIETPVGSIPVISTQPTRRDLLGAWKVRWGFGRMSYTISPGLYAVGEPDAHSPVLVSANYKLTFDTLRAELSGLRCWMLILDTNGVNVWCAAGKGTFGTDGLVRMIEETELSMIVSSKRLILPQLGASGVNGLEVKRRAGFDVLFGPVRAQDVKQYIDAGFKKTPEMSRVRFTTPDRIKLTPIEMATAARQFITVFGVMFLVNLFARDPFGAWDFVALVGAALCGTFLTPILLPYIPVKAFASKGMLVGLVWAALTILLLRWQSPPSTLLALGYALALPAISAWYAMSFTGSSTYTSPSGVMKEMRISLPFIVGAGCAGTIFILIQRIFG